MNNHKELILFVLDQALDQPVPKRIRLYQALAEICGDPKEQEMLQTMASRLGAADALCREFKFSNVQVTSAK